jgi:hypothetical protein
VADLHSSLLADEIKRQLRAAVEAHGKKLAAAERSAGVSKDVAPMPTEAWSRSHYHVGAAANPEGVEGGLWEPLRTHLVEVFDDPTVWCVLELGSAGWGKTTLAKLIMKRCKYLLNCEAAPQRRGRGLQEHAAIVYYFMNRTDEKARRSLYREFRDEVMTTDYFSREFPVDQTWEKFLSFPKHIEVYPVGGSPKKIKSDNVAGAVLDEVNDWPVVEGSVLARSDEHVYDSAVQTLNELQIRMMTRFALPHGDEGTAIFPPWCKVVVLSQALSPDDPIERMAEERKNEKGVLIIRHAEWETKPKRFYCGRTFRVAIPKKGTEPFVVDTQADMDRAAAIGAEVRLDVPVEHEEVIRKRPAFAVAQLIGVATMAVQQWFQVGKWDECVAARAEYERTHGWPAGNLGSEDVSVGLEDGWHLRPEFFGTDPDGNVRPLIDTDVARFVRVDLGISGDPVGFSMHHVCGMATVKRWEGSIETTIDAPVFWYDLLLRIVPPPRGEVRISRVRDLIVNLRDHWGFTIGGVKYDHFASEEQRQELKAAGFRAAVESVASVMGPWIALRDALDEGRAMVPSCEAARDELDLFEHQRKGSKEWVEFSRPRATRRGAGDIRDASHGDVIEVMAGGALDCLGAKSVARAWPIQVGAAEQRPEWKQALAESPKADPLAAKLIPPGEERRAARMAKQQARAVDRHQAGPFGWATQRRKGGGRYTGS